MRATHALFALALAACQPGGEPLPYGESAAECGACHTTQHDAFAASSHAASARSPVLEALLPRVEAAWGSHARGRCESCHAPRHAEGDEGVTCLSCHAAVGNRAERDGLLVVDPGPGLAGPSHDAVSPAHGTRPSTLLASPSLCGTCHEVTGPSLFVEPTLGEHLASPAFADGEHCMDCHMPLLEPDARRDHGFVGLDPPWGASPEAAARAAERTLALLRAALALRASEAARTDGTRVVRVELENVARGHDVPTGIAMLRDVAVEVRWGGLDAPPARVLELGDRMMRGDTEVDLPTDADRVEHRRLAPDEVRTIELPIPRGATGVELVLVARAFREGTLEALGLAHRRSDVPIHRVAVVALDLAP